MHRILIAVVIALWAFALAYAGSGSLGSGRARVLVVKSPAATAQDMTNIQTWLDSRPNIDVVGMAVGNGEVVLLFRQ